MKTIFFFIVLSLFIAPLSSSASHVAAASAQVTPLLATKSMTKKELRKEMKKIRKHKNNTYYSIPAWVIYVLFFTASSIILGLLGLLLTAIFSWGAVGWAISGGLIGLGFLTLLLIILFG